VNFNLININKKYLLFLKLLINNKIEFKIEK
jgi:hypothetical protein